MHTLADDNIPKLVTNVKVIYTYRSQRLATLKIMTSNQLIHNKMNEQRAKAKSSGFQNNVSSSRTLECRLGVKRHTKGRSEELFKLIRSRSIPKWDYIHAVLDTSYYEMYLISTRTTALQRSRCHTWKINAQRVS